MTWKNGRQLATLQDSDDTISYEYDSNSVRIKKTVDGVEHTYAYLGGKLMYETRGEAKFYYSYDANGYLYNVKYTLTDDSERKSYFFTHNSFGDIIGIYSGSGALTAKYEYDAWGNVLSVTDANGNTITSETHIGNLNPFRYRGYYYDSDTGLYYLISRYYDPVTHRFINADGYFQSGGSILDTNMSAYCRNNPIMNADPTGKITWYQIQLNLVNGVDYIYDITVVTAAQKAGLGPNDEIPLSILSSSSLNKRPYKGKPNSTYHAPNGDSRIYGPDGLPLKDYDHNDHGNPSQHPHDENGGHYHDWENGVRGPAYTFSWEPILGFAIATVCVIGIVVIAVDDLTMVGISNDVLIAPLSAGVGNGINMMVR